MTMPSTFPMGMGGGGGGATSAFFVVSGAGLAGAGLGGVRRGLTCAETTDGASAMRRTKTAVQATGRARDEERIEARV